MLTGLVNFALNNPWLVLAGVLALAVAGGRTGYDAVFWTTIALTALIALLLTRKTDGAYLRRNPEPRIT